MTTTLETYRDLSPSAIQKRGVEQLRVDQLALWEERSAAWTDMQRLVDISKRSKLTNAQSRSFDDAESLLISAAAAMEQIDRAIWELENRQRVENGGEPLIYAPIGGLHDARTDPAELNKLDHRLTDAMRAAAEGHASSGAYAEGKALTRSQTFGGYLQTRGLVRDSFGGDEQLDLGKYLRGLATGDWTNADAERRAMSEGVQSAGGYAVPIQLLGQVIDLARSKTRVFEAGAQLVPMETQTVKVAKWAGDPSTAWHSENAAITPSDASLGSVELKAKALASLTVASKELLEDASNIEQELKNAFAAQFALTLDKAALYGTGTDPEPRGVKNTAGVTTAALAANGRTPTWDDLIDAAGVLQDRNEDATGQLYAPRTARALGKAKTTDGQYVTPPTMLEGIARLTSNQVPTNLVQGTSGAVASDIFTGDWRQLLIGVRTSLQIEVMTERYADTGQLGFLAWFRGDVAVGRPGAFHVQTGALA